MEYLIAFLIGISLGSFYNVLIYRIPRNISVIFPSSRCPSCGHRIRWYDNIPILSYLILRGRCRHCGERISPQYPIVESVSGLLAVLAVYRWGVSPDGVFMYLFFSALLVASLIDLRFFIIPDIITVPGTILGLASSPFREIGLTGSLIGAVGGFIIPLAIYLYYIRVRKLEGLGFGDVKLLTFIGSFTGIYGVLSALFLGSAVGLIYAVPSIIRNRTLSFAIPFGPFLSLGCFGGILLEDFIYKL